MPDVVLACMPFAAVEHPSIALGVLKACLAQRAISAKVVYPNLVYIDAIGVEVYTSMEMVPIEYQLGEAIFSSAAFPDFPLDVEVYLRKMPAGLKKLTPDVLMALRGEAEGFVLRTAESILEFNPRIVGCSSTFQQTCASLALLRCIHRLDPSVVTMMGGANCEGPMGVVMKRDFPWVDIVVSGEADLLIADLCEMLIEKGRDVDPALLPYGVIGASPAPVGEFPRTMVWNLDQVPAPDYQEYFETLARTKIGDLIEPGLLVETSRGCWWGQKHHCTFCGLNGTGMEYRSKSPDRVLREFSELAERYGTRNIEVVDNILNNNYVKTVMPALAARPQPLNIFFETKSNLKREEIRQLSAAGVRWIQSGMESMHNDVLKLLDKGNTVWTNIQLLKWCQYFGVRSSWNLLTNVPGEKDEWYAEMADVFPLIYHLQPPTGAPAIRFDRFSPYHNNPANYGLSLAPFWGYASVYPLPETSLVDFVYFFENRNTEDSPRPGLQMVHTRLTEWNDVFWSLKPDVHRPILTMTDSGKCITLTDTRPCAIRKDMALEGLERDIYLVCDEPASPRSLVAALQTRGIPATWNDAEPCLRKLLDFKILWEHRGHYLSLAVPEPCTPLLYQWEYPGGTIMTNSMKTLKKLIRLREAQSYSPDDLPFDVAFGFQF